MQTSYSDESIESQAYFLLTRSFDIETGSQVLRKTVGTRGNATAALGLLSHEFAVLDSLKGIKGVPHALRFDGARRELVMRPFVSKRLDEGQYAGRLEWTSLVDIALGALRVLQQVHARGVLHLALSPYHIGVDKHALRAGRDPEVMITGFTLAVLPGVEATPFVEEARYGHLAYASPERTGFLNRTIDQRSDLYSLGVVLFELACGRLPFDDEDPSPLVKSLAASRAGESANTLVGMRTCNVAPTSNHIGQDVPPRPCV